MKIELKRLRSGETIVIDPNAWHAKWYTYWKAQAEFKVHGYRENLCHYVRVVGVWTPLNWLERTRIFGRIPAWIAAMLAVLTAMYLLLPSWSVVMSVFTTMLALLVIDVILPWPLKKRYSKRLTAPLQPVLGPIGRFSRAYLNQPATRCAQWFFCHRFYKGVYPWSLLAAMLFALWAVVLPFEVAVLAIMLAICSVIFLIVAGITYGLMQFGDWRDARRDYDSEPERPRTHSTVRIARTYVQAKREGHCPFIEFASTEATG